MTYQQVDELRQCIDSVPNFTEVLVSPKNMNDDFDLYDAIREGKLLPDLINLRSVHFELISVHEKIYAFDSLNFCPAGMCIEGKEAAHHRS